MKVLIAVASKHGSTREIATAIADELKSEQIDVVQHEAADVKDIEEYNAVILGSAIYAGRWMSEAKSFAEQFHEALTKIPVWLFSSGPLGEPDPKPQDDPAALATPMSGVPVRDHHMFVGKLDKSTLGFGERLIATAVHAPDGDFRDWADVRSWAANIARELAAPVAAE